MNLMNWQKRKNNNNNNKRVWRQAPRKVEVGFIRDAVIISGGPLLRPARVQEAIVFRGFYTPPLDDIFS